MKILLIISKIVLVALFFSTSVIYCQEYNSPVNFIPKTPEAKLFGIFGDIENNGNNGLPDITIPLHDVVLDNVKIPISISYSADGIRVNETSTAIGLKWALNAGGLVSRTINGVQDELVHAGWMHMTDVDYNWYFDRTMVRCKNLEDFKEFHDNHRDISPDFFSYNIGKNSGQFVIKRNGSIIESLQSNSIITYCQNLNFFNVVDDSGVKYLFADKEATTANVYAGSISPSIWNPLNMGPPNVWKISEIQTTFGKLIKFGYLDYDYITHPFPTGYSVKKTIPLYQPIVQDCGAIIEHKTMISYKSKQLERIQTENELVKFVYVADNTSDYSVMKLRLNEVLIFSMKDTLNPLKRIHFQHDVYQNSGKLKLTGILFYGADNQLYDKYFFHYITGDIPAIGNTSQDVFGYYNGAANDFHLIPVNVPGTTIVPANRDVNASYISMGLLEKIVFPTGGITKFTYEPNKYVGLDGEIVYYPGTRVKKIQNYDNDNALLSEKLFEYGKGFTGDLYVQGSDFSEYVRHKDTGEPERVYKYNEYSSSPASPYFDSHERQEGFGYDEVKTIYSNNSYKKQRFKAFPSFNRFIWMPTETAIFDANSDTLMHQVTNFIITDTCFFGLPIGHESFFGIYQKPYMFTGFQHCDDGTYCSLRGDQCPDSFIYYPPLDPFISVKGHRMYVKKESMTEFFDDLSFISQTDYEYNFKQQLIERTKSVTDRNGNAQNNDYLKETFKYIVDDNINWIALGTKNALINSNIINQPIYAVSYFGSTKQANGYKLILNNLGQILNVKSIEIPFNSDEGVFTFHSDYNYNGSNQRLIQKTTIQGVNSYIWGYNHALPIASVGNSVPNKIAYTSFEELTNDGMGGWIYNTGAGFHANESSYTGNRSFKGSSITKSGLPSDTYIVSYWARKSPSGNGSITVNGNVQTFTSNQWVYKEIELNNPGSINISLSSVYIDELRLYPKGAFMTTYTHSPLIGITSQTDPRGLTTRYEYDGFGRLKRVRDHEGKILQEYDYNYAGSQP